MSSTRPTSGRSWRRAPPAPRTWRPRRRPATTDRRADTQPAALELLAEERAAWRPFEALAGLTDDQLAAPVAAAHDWSGRDLIAHLVGWLGDGLEVARELALGPHSEARLRSRREFAARGDEINAEIEAAWGRLPLGEVRRRLREVPEELRRAILGVPAASWQADPENLRFFHVYTVEHYDDHLADLAAIVDAAGRGPRGDAE